MLHKFAKHCTRFQDVQCKNVTIKAMIADTEETRQRGLAGVPTLPDNCGMLFDFGDGEQERCFHMKGCKIDIEALALSSTGRILAVRSMKFCQPNVLHRLPTCAKVLEVRAGFCAQHGISPGDIIHL